MKRLASLALLILSLSACGKSEGETVIAETETSLQRIAGDWKIIGLNGRVSDAAITLSLRPNSTLSGQAPCNQYSANYNVSGATDFTVSSVRSTRRACPDLPTESEYFATLETVIAFRLSIDSRDLRLLNKAGKAVLVFVPAQ